MSPKVHVTHSRCSPKFLGMDKDNEPTLLRRLITEATELWEPISEDALNAVWLRALPATLPEWEAPEDAAAFDDL